VTSCFRLSSGKYPSDSGAGAGLYGGRWNPRGIDVVYASATASLAALEILVHFSILPREFVLTQINIEASIRIEVVDAAVLPAGWQANLFSPFTQNFGRDWALGLRSSVLSVPSAVIESERNFVINPNHPEFVMIQFSPPKPFRFDPRLKKA
jgi:RES domain-containing protein